MNYAEEVKELEAYKNLDWFKPTKGTYTIMVTGEGQHVEKTFGEDTVQQWNLPILVGGKELWWSVTKGKTISSLYGQICTLAARNQNKAEGIKFTLIVKNDGKKNDYTIPEALSSPSAITGEKTATKEEVLQDD